ncbi:MAG: hypothetical protein ACYC6T_08190 [Thermoleophilia bacterium]
MGNVLAVLAIVLWAALLLAMRALCRRVARRNPAQERAHQEWLLRGWDR